MRIDPGILIGLTSGAAVWLFVRWRSPVPKFTPLLTSPDDRLMADALAKAQASTGQFLTLACAPYQGCLVKLRFVSSSDQVEHLWDEVLELCGDGELGVPEEVFTYR